MFLSSLFSRMIWCPSEQFFFKSLNFIPSDNHPVPNKSLIVLVITFLFLYLTPRWYKYFVSPSHVRFSLGLKDVKLYKWILLLPLWQTRYLPFFCSKFWILPFTYALASPQILLPFSKLYFFGTRVLDLIISAHKNKFFKKWVFFSNLVSPITEISSGCSHPKWLEMST